LSIDAPPTASLRRRIAALLYESTLLSAVSLVAGFLLAPAVSPLPSSAFAPATTLQIPSLPGRVLMFCGVFLVGALYFGWTWSGGRRTLPMKTWRIRLRLRDGESVDPKAALIRYAAAWIGPCLALVAYIALKPTGFAKHALWLLALGYAWALIDPDRQFLHDRIAGTRVVDDAEQAVGLAPGDSV
jgi:uncharacterized RDD family membrane protein YckC